jgi:hypothetical protein
LNNAGVPKHHRYDFLDEPLAPGQLARMDLICQGRVHNDIVTRHIPLFTVPLPKSSDPSLPVNRPLTEVLAQFDTGARAAPRGIVVVMRRAVGRRRWLANHDDMMNWTRTLLPDAEVVELPPDASISTQAATLRSATVVVSPHGAGLSGLIFCLESTSVIEITPAPSSPNTYPVLSGAMQLNYFGTRSENNKNAMGISRLRYEDLLRRAWLSSWWPISRNTCTE